MRFQEGDIVGYVGDNGEIFSKRRIVFAGNDAYEFQELDGRKLHHFMFLEFPDWWVKTTLEEMRIPPERRPRRRREIVEESKKGKGIKLKQPDIVMTADLLRQHCASADGFAIYGDGYDDERVAKEMEGKIPYIKTSHVEHLRRMLFGKLPPKDVKPTMITLLARIERLEAWAAARPVVPFKQEGPQ